jgi:hypothetical protein
MTTIKATVKGRRLELEVPEDWPDGTEVVIHPLEPLGQDAAVMTPDEIARTLAAMDQVEPLILTDEERAAWDAERRDRKDWEHAHFEEHAEKLRRMWE